MTIQEVRALIDAKIKGQGTNVDAGSVLPIILNGILDLINEGGGGTSDAVQYIPQELTESQQMQARKNLDLYYEETTTERLEYDPDGQQVSGGPVFSEEYFIKASDTPIALDDLGTVMAVLQWDEEKEIEITPDKILDNSAMGWYCVFQDGEQTGMPIVTVILEDSASPFLATLTKGVWFYLSGNNHTLWVEYSATTIHQIPAKYIPDMPSGGIETVELLSIPTNYANSVAESTFFSADDLAKVKSSDVCIAAYSASPARKFLVVNDAGALTFYGKDGVEFILQPYYTEGYFTVTPINGGSIILSGLPTASMTQAELEALGFGLNGQNIGVWTAARAKNVVINDLFNSQVLGVIVLTFNYLEFWDATNKYVVTNQNLQLACTVTPRT